MCSKVVKRLSGSLRELRDIRSFVRRHCQQSALDEESTMQLELAVNEIASNIMKYAYQQPADRPLEVEFSATERQVAVRLVHWGQSFTPRSVQPPAFDGSREHGFGLYIVDQCVDQVSYHTVAGGRNCIELIKKCAPGGKEKTQMKLQVEKVDDVTLVTIPEENLDAGNAKDFTYLPLRQ